MMLRRCNRYVQATSSSWKSRRSNTIFGTLSLILRRKLLSYFALGTNTKPSSRSLSILSCVIFEFFPSLNNLYCLLNVVKHIPHGESEDGIALNHPSWRAQHNSHENFMFFPGLSLVNQQFLHLSSIFSAVQRRLSALMNRQSTGPSRPKPTPQIKRPADTKADGPSSSLQSNGLQHTVVGAVEELPESVSVSRCFDWVWMFSIK